MPETITEILAGEALDFSYERLPDDVVHKAEQLVLSILGGGLAGHAKEPSKMMEGLARELQGPPEATVFGSGMKTSVLNATLANVTKVSGNADKAYPMPEANFHAGGHGQMIPALLALAEREHSSGRDFLNAVVASYEIANKIYASFGGNFGLLDHGWYTDAVGRPVALALSAGRLMGLDRDQLVNAAGMAGCFTLVPFVIYSPTTRHSPELRTSMGLMNSLLSSLLAKQGFTGPRDLFEGNYGLAQIVTAGDMDLDWLRKPRQDWTILYTGVNTFAGDGDMSGFIQAASSLAIEHDIRPEDVAKVVVKTTEREARRLGDPNVPHLRAPKTVAVANHSCFYVTSVAIVYRGKGHDQFTDEALRDPDPRVWELMSKVEVAAEPRFEGFNLRGSAAITTTSGQTFTREVLHPRGLHPMSPLQDDDVEELFRFRTSKLLSESEIEHIMDVVYHLDALDDVSELPGLLVAH